LSFFCKDNRYPSILLSVRSEWKVGKVGQKMERMLEKIKKAIWQNNKKQKAGCVWTILEKLFGRSPIDRRSPIGRQILRKT
jgi:hypothetical protein